MDIHKMKLLASDPKPTVEKGNRYAEDVAWLIKEIERLVIVDELTENERNELAQLRYLKTDLQHFISTHKLGAGPAFC